MLNYCSARRGINVPRLITSYPILDNLWATAFFRKILNRFSPGKTIQKERVGPKRRKSAARLQTALAVLVLKP